ncbi:MAG: LCP family protein [Mycobacteriales bacterium]
MTDPRDWKAGGEQPPAERPRANELPAHLDPRGPRHGVPPRPPRTVPPRKPGSARHAAGGRPVSAAGMRGRATWSGSGAVLPDTPPPRRRRAARVMSWIAVVTSVSILAAAGAGWALLSFYDGKINRIPGLDIGTRPADLPRDAKNILIVGSDSRGDLKPGEGTQGTGKNFVSGQRSDTVILAHLYGDADQAQLISFPRDAWVEIPEHTDLETGEFVQARMGKLNIAFFEGGPPLLIRTISQLTGLYVDHYMQIDFDGFQAIVDKLDGVEVCLPKAAKEKDSGIDLPAGRSVIKGDQALAFVRQRKGLPGGDIDRIERQQQFIGAIVRKVLSAGTLLNPVRINGVVTVATESLEVDEDLGRGDLQKLALRLRNFDAGGVVFTTVPIEKSNGYRQGQSVVLLDEAEGAVLFDQLRRDQAPAAPEKPGKGAEPSEPLIVAPDKVRVRVYNSAGAQGLARQAAGELERVGFQIVGEPGNRGSGAEQTVVVHGSDKADSARTLAAALPGADLRLDPALDGKPLEVLVGSSFTTAREVTVQGGRTSRPAAASPTSAPVVTAAQDPCAA